MRASIEIMVVFERMRGEQDFLFPESLFAFRADDLVVHCGGERGKAMIHEGVLLAKGDVLSHHFLVYHFSH